MSNKNEFECLVGKTIIKAEGEEERGYLTLVFSDGSEAHMDATIYGALEITYKDSKDE